MKTLLTITLFVMSFLSEKYDIRLKLEKNKTYYQTSVSEMKINQVIEGQDFTMNSNAY